VLNVGLAIACWYSAWRPVLQE